MLSKRFKIRASSLTESIIAMVIIAVCLSTTMVVYIRILGTDRNMPSYRAEQKVKELLAETKNTRQFADEDYSFDSYRLSKKVEELSDDGSLYRIRFEIRAGARQDKYEYVVAD